MQCRVYTWAAMDGAHSSWNSLQVGFIGLAMRNSQGKESAHYPLVALGGLCQLRTAARLGHRPVVMGYIYSQNGQLTLCGNLVAQRRFLQSLLAGVGGSLSEAAPSPCSKIYPSVPSPVRMHARHRGPGGKVVAQRRRAPDCISTLHTHRRHSLAVACPDQASRRSIHSVVMPSAHRPHWTIYKESPWGFSHDPPAVAS